MQKNAQKNKSFFTIVIWIYFTMHVFCILIPTFLFWPWNSDHAILNNFWNYFMGYMRVSILLGTRNIRNKVYFVIFHVRLLHFHQHLFNNLILYFKLTKKMHNNEIVNTCLVDVIDLLVIPICAFCCSVNNCPQLDWFSPSSPELRRSPPPLFHNNRLLCDLNIWS